MLASDRGAGCPTCPPKKLLCRPYKLLYRFLLPPIRDACCPDCMTRRLAADVIPRRPARKKPSTKAAK